MPKQEGGERSLELKSRVGKHIHAARTKKGLTQKALADKLGVVVSTVCDWERGRSYPSVENLRAIGRELGESVSYLTADLLGKRNSLEALSRQLGAMLGYRRLQLLVDVPEARLKHGVDAIIGASIADDRPADSRSHTR